MSLPHDASLWSVEEVTTWLKREFFQEQVVSTFSAELITGCVLLTLTDDDLKEMGLKQLGIRKLILMKIKKLEQTCASNSSSQALEHSTADLMPSGGSATPCRRSQARSADRSRSRSKHRLGEPKLFSEGDVVTLRGLTSQTNLNGREAIVTALPKTTEDRVQVQLVDGSSKAIRGENLSLVKRSQKKAAAPSSQGTSKQCPLEPTTFSKGDVVRLKGLTCQVDLNGRQAIVTTPSRSAGDRVQVQLSDGSSKAVRSENLNLIRKSKTVETKPILQVHPECSTSGSHEASQHAQAEGSALCSRDSAQADDVPAEPASTVQNATSISDMPIDEAAPEPMDASSTASETIDESRKMNRISTRQLLRAEVLDQETQIKMFAYSCPAEVKDHESCIKSRVRKMLDMAFHPNTGRAESSQALRNARKLMHKYQLDEQDVLDSAPIKDDERAGISSVVVSNINTEAKKKDLLSRWGDHERTLQYLLEVDDVERVSFDSWLHDIADAICLYFDVACMSRQSRCLFVEFYGDAVQAHSAAYGFTCAINRIEWMAGDRALPVDGVVTWNQGPTLDDFGKHRGKRFSTVLDEDPEYLEWAKTQEVKLREHHRTRSDTIEHFIEFSLSQESPESFDTAYKQGLAAELLKIAKEDKSKEEAVSTALAISAVRLQKKALDESNITIEKSFEKAACVRGFRHAQISGTQDAKHLDLRQRQVETAHVGAIEI
eukprot:TRINITY_DN17361_c0_g3_i1.p1 TRINITY_DN17361_c0_g3~~TRINITY_DN17361_c0_g3_i1.p1  ORF type:complete len:717 (-),score=144.57 TRINITY_DN17361_c0_g3_i1:149-2299(-)